MRRPTRHPTPQPWLDRNQLTDLLAAAEDEGGDAYAMTCLLALNGLRVSEACNANVTNLGGSRYQPTLRILGKGDKPAEIVLNPRTWQAIDQVVARGSQGPLRRNRWATAPSQHRGDPRPARQDRRDQSTRDIPRTTTFLYHHRSTAGRAPPRDAARRPPHQGRHHHRLRPVAPVIPPRPDLRAHVRNRTITLQAQPLPERLERANSRCFGGPYRAT